METPSNQTSAARPRPLDPALRFDPFQGEFGDQGDRTLRDRIVKTRKPSECSQCGEAIPVGQTVRSRTDIVDGGMMAWKWCNTCTCLMARCFSRGADAQEAAEKEYEARCRMNAEARRVRRRPQQ